MNCTTINIKNNFVLCMAGIIFTVLITPCSIAQEITANNSNAFSDKRTKTISMDFKGALLNDVLKIFSQQSGLNFISASDVANNPVNLYLDKVPVEEALERILSANNLTYEINPRSNIFIVKQVVTPEQALMTRVYHLKHATVSSSKLNSMLKFGCGESDESKNAGSLGGIMGAIKILLSEYGSIIEDARTNSIIITDIPQLFPIIEQTISQLDIRVPQILIEVEMLDVSKNSAELLGAKFENTPVTFYGAQKLDTFPFNFDNILDDNATNCDFAITAERDNQFYASNLSFAGLSFALQFLKTQSDTRNLAHPRILTLSNETAEIQIMTDEAIGLSSSTTASEGTSTSVAEAERVETGVFLRVTPQVNIRTREIVMAIEPKVVEAKTGQTFGGQTFKDPEERGTKSILRIKSGETIIIGGLLKDTSSETNTKVPVLERIPILGAAFRHKDKTETQRELVIFITPAIINENSAPNIFIPHKWETNHAPAATKNQSKKLGEIEKEFSFYNKKIQTEKLKKIEQKTSSHQKNTPSKKLKKIAEEFSRIEKQQRF